MKYIKIVDRDFYKNDTINVAKDLLGKVFVHESIEGICSGIIVETEAYCGIHDQACHSYGWRRTRRNETMYSQGGTLYVYMIYGLYFCVNIVTKKVHEPEAVLIRAIQPIEGFDIMKKRRLQKSKIKNHPSDLNWLCNGPGKLAQAMGISTLHNGFNLLEGTVYVAQPLHSKTIKIVQKPRIGIDYAKDAKEYPWRFYITDNPFVSKL
jgi:DNA-3-methyladenine glycosylase